MANELSVLRPVVEHDNEQEHNRAIRHLEDELRSLKRDLEDAVTEKDRLERTIRNLQKTLNPFHRALRMLFGEMDLAVGEVSNADVHPSMPNGDSLTSVMRTALETRWQNYKNQFPGVPTEIIDALLIHGEMRITNLAGLLKHDVRTIYRAEAKLRKAGATTLNGGLLSLKR